IHEYGLNGIPNYNIKYGEDFDDNPKNMIKFANQLFSDDNQLSEIDIYIKHPSTGGGRGIVPVSFSRHNMEKTAYLSQKVSEINNAISTCHKEGEKFLPENVKKPLVLQFGIKDAQHIEVQMIGDKIIGLRECSAQERGQKKAEGTVSLEPKLIEEIKQQAKVLAVKSNLTGPNTIELLVPKNNFYFLEINTRLQVEHPVTDFESEISVIGAFLADNLGIDITSLLESKKSNAVRHIRLTGLVDGQAKILTSQTEMQSIMDQKFGKGTVRVRIKQNPNIDAMADQQFGALVIVSKKQDPQLSIDVLKTFETNFKSTNLIVPFRTIYAVLNAYKDGNPFNVGEFIPPASPSQMEIKKAKLAQILNKHLNNITVKGEQPTEIKDFDSLIHKLDQLLNDYETNYPLSDKTATLSTEGWNKYWEQQPKVSFSIELRDYLQSLLAHVTHPKVTEVMQRVVNRLPGSASLYEAPGVSGAGPQTSAVLHMKDPASNRQSSNVLTVGLERGVYMNGLEAANDHDRGLMKLISHEIEKETYGTFMHNGQEYSNYLVTDFHAPNNAKSNARTVVENLKYNRPAIGSVSWNPTQTIAESRVFFKAYFSEYKQLQDELEKHGISIPDPLGFYIKCPSTTNLITSQILLDLFNLIVEIHSNYFDSEIKVIKGHLHNLLYGENKDHQTIVAQDVMNKLNENPTGPRFCISGTFPLGGYGASHPDVTQLSSERDLSVFKDATKILEVIHQLIRAFDVSETVTPSDPSFEGPGGMAASAINDLKEIKARLPENQAIQKLTYEKAINLGVDILGMRTLVTPLSQYNFLAGIKIAEEYGIIGQDGELDLQKTKTSFLDDLKKGHLKCQFPEPVLAGMQDYNSDFPNPNEDVVNKILDINGRKKVLDLPSISSTITTEDVQKYMIDLHKKLGYQPTYEDALTALRFGSDCAYLQKKKMQGAGAEVMPLEDFIGSRKLNVGSKVDNHIIKSIEEEGLNYVVELEKNGETQVITIPNNDATSKWVKEELATSKKFNKDNQLSFAFDNVLNSKILDSYPKGSVLKKSEDGVITLYDSAGNPIELLDKNPNVILKYEAIKMVQQIALPGDLEPGEYKMIQSDYLVKLAKEYGDVHPAAKGFEMLALDRLG
ncbi:MAG: hypothetical protein VXX85_04080, partial [Candidatus Margulisiibacteriota bacterium]|nr:hypothetical protein [Candidatus Margulisiibacteriota bacterium]